MVISKYFWGCSGKRVLQECGERSCGAWVRAFGLEETLAAIIAPVLSEMLEDSHLAQHCHADCAKSCSREARLASEDARGQAGRGDQHGATRTQQGARQGVRRALAALAPHQEGIREEKRWTLRDGTVAADPAVGTAGPRPDRRSQGPAPPDARRRSLQKLLLLKHQTTTSRREPQRSTTTSHRKAARR